jgi:hypothetical protein
MKTTFSQAKKLAHKSAIINIDLRRFGGAP